MRKRIAIVVFIAIVTMAVALVGPRTASACSCMSVDPIDMVTAADVVFTGTVTDNTGTAFAPVWQFAVEGVIKGDVEAQETVIGEDWGGGCGTDFARFTVAIVVYASEMADELHALGCSPTPSAAEFETLISQIAEPSGSGPPAAVMSGVVHGSNVAVIDSDGRTIARRQLDISSAEAIAHCRGTERAVVYSSFPEPTITFVDLSTLTVLESRPIAVDRISVVGDRLACLADGSTVVAAVGYGPEAQPLTIVSSASIDGADVTTTDSFEAVSRAVIHGDEGTVFLLPHDVDEPLRTIDAVTLKALPRTELALPDGLSSLDGDVSPDGSKLAILATLDGSEVRWDSGASHVVLVGLREGVPIGDEPAVIELDGGAGDTESSSGAAKWIRWIDDSSFVVEAETMSGKRLRIVTDQGDTTADVDAGWGWGLVPVPSGMLRTSGGGLEVLTPEGETNEGDPAPVRDSDRSLWIAPLIDPPALDTVTEDVGGFTITPVNSEVDGDAVPDDSPDAVEQAADEPQQTNNAPTDGAPSESAPSDDASSDDEPSDDERAVDDAGPTVERAAGAETPVPASNRGLWIGAIIAALVAITGAGLLLLRRRQTV